MKVNALFFAHYGDLVGSRGLTRELPVGATVRELAEGLEKDYPQVGALLDCCRPAVNAEHAGAEKVLNDGDEVAFLPPVSGG